MTAAFQHRTTGPAHLSGSRFASCRRAPRFRNTRPAKRAAGQKTAPRNFFRAPSKPRRENRSQVTGTHLESRTYRYVFAPGCVVAPNSTATPYIDTLSDAELYKYEAAKYDANHQSTQSGDGALFKAVTNKFGSEYAFLANAEPKDQFLFASKEVHTPLGTTSEIMGLGGVNGKDPYVAVVGGIGKNFNIPLGPLGKVGVTYVPAAEYSFNGAPPVLDHILEINLGPVGFGGFKMHSETGVFVYRNITSTIAVGGGMGW